MNLRKLSREDLLELLILQSSEIENLEKELQDLNQKYEEEEQIISSCTSLAEAVLKLNHVIDNLEIASEEYLDALKYHKD